MRRLLTREKKLMSLKVTLKVTRRETAHAPSLNQGKKVNVFESNSESHKARDGACAVSLPVIFSCHGDGALFKSWPLWGGQTFKKKNKKKVKKKKKIKKKNPRGGDDACAVS
jgi:hypothetical protein